MLLVGSLNVPAAGAAAEGEPSLRLTRAKSEVQLFRYGKRVQLDLGVYLAALEAPFELQVTRPVYAEPLVLNQVIRGAGTPSYKALDAGLLAGWSGLARFFKVEVKDASGVVLRSRQMTFCPNGYRERLSDDGPQVPTFPEGCGGHPFARGMVWGIDEEWAVGAFGWDAPRVRLEPGRYGVSVAIQEPYLELFGIDPAHASVELSAVVEDGGGCRYCEGHRASQADGSGAYRTAPTMDDPDPSLLPDMMSLPAWGIHVNNRRNGRSFLTFGATVWAGGAASLVVEGFRRSETDVMDAYQYFYQDGEPVGRSSVGTLEYDPRRGHHHWHFLQFAKYSLTREDQSEIVKSKKESFCLAPTDAIDLTLENAERNPWNIGLGTACGSPNSLWVRETLPLGWGDTYHQGIPGQSFNITTLPNGRYFIAVEANPGALLHEQDLGNNIEYREVRLRGKPGARRVVVPPWNGIDSESHHGGHFGGM